MATLLAIDLGTEGARVGAFSPDGARLATAHVPYPTTYPRHGWAEQDPEAWWSATIEATRKVLADAGPETAASVTGIGVATTASTVVVVDEAGRSLRPALLWMDSRAHEEARETARHADEHPVLAYSGGADAVEWLVPKAMWLARNEPDNYRDAHRIAEAVDYLTWRLTGEWVGSRMNATCKWNYDTPEGRLSARLYDALGVPDLADKLPPEIRPVGEPAGKLHHRAAEELGIGGSPVVAVGGIDAHVSLLACGDPTPGLVSAVAGTSTAIITEVADPVYSPAVWGPYPSALRTGQWLIEGGQVSSGSALTWVAQTALGVDRAGLSELIREAQAVPPVRHGLLALDHFMGNRTPHRDPRLRGAILGLTLGATPAEIYRAVVEAVSYGTRSVLDSWRDAGIPVDRLVLSGGVRHNPLWLQATADVLGRPLDVADSDNMTLRAGAAMAAYAAGEVDTLADGSRVMGAQAHTIEPDPTAVDLYREGYERYQRVTELLRPELHKLADTAGGRG